MSEDYRRGPDRPWTPGVTQEPPYGLGYRKPWRPRIRVPWTTLLLLGLIAYQVSPEFQGWVNYQIRVGLQWGRYFGDYTRWWLKQPPGASDV